MPSQSHPQAQFVPISPDFNLDALVDSSNNFDYVARIPVEILKDHPSHQFEALVLNQVIKEGKPLVIEGWGESLPPWLFSRQWLEDNLGSKHEKVRDISNNVDIPMTLGHYLRSMDKLTKMFSTSKGSYKDERRQRLYLKDIDCPDAWAASLKESMPESVYYLNDCIESRTGGDGAIREPNEYGQMMYGKGVAPAGDLMSSLPPDMRALNMMCYIGHEGTYTPSHREMCASLGHNIMVEASKAGQGEKAGSSIWFMTETSERELVSEYFLSMLGHDIEVERHFAQVNAWKKAPFNVWVVEQKVGDLILIPPLAPHQVWNRGTRTVKAAWNRTTVDTLELALHEALPRARMVCRDEQYKCKAIIYYTLANYFELLQRDTIEQKMWKYGRIKQLLDDFKRLFDLFQEVLVSEMFSPKLPDETDVELLPYDSNVTCSYCRCNIFNRFLTCKTCILYGEEDAEDTYDICMDCYAMGRSCACISNMKWVEQWEWPTLVGNYEQWRNIVVQSDGFFDARRSPQPLEIARKRYGKKPIAEVCQEQLKARPWTDITKPRELTPDMSDVEPEVNDEGRIVKPKKSKQQFPPNRRGRVEPKKNKTRACHICCHHDYNWKLAFCTTCPLAYCYGTLFRAFDMMPQTVMEDKEWQCPKCLKICSCGQCRKHPSQTPYLPKGTLLGHDTRKVADHRSVESLVDFSKTNLKWLQHEEETQESGRMKRLKERAEAEKARLDNIDQNPDHENGNGADDVSDGADSDAHEREMADIDPELRGGASLAPPKIASQYRSPFARPGVNGTASMVNNTNGEAATSDDEAGLNGNSTPAEYQPELAAPVAPMMTTEETYPDPSLVGANRMMGMGYFQQGQGADRILYDVGGSPGDTPRQNPQNPNLAFSDLVDPALQAEEAKKRRRHGGSHDEEDVEFFTSKRQKLLAKKTREEGQYRKIRPEKVPPRRSIGKKSYVDLGEDAVPIEDDEGPSVFSHGGQRTTKPREKKPDGTDTDMELAALAMGRLSKPKADKPAVTRRSFRTRQEALAELPLGSAPNTIKTPRKSAWLARKEAEDNGESFPTELPAKRSRRSTGANDGSDSAAATIEISSGSEDNDDGGVELGWADDVDSLFGEPLDESLNKETSSDEVQTTEINERNDDEDVPRVQVMLKPIPYSVSPPNLVNSEDEEERPAPKRRGRGRPPKKQVAPSHTKSESSSPPPFTAPPKTMMSLKEKLAMKGRSAKIVAKDKSSPSASGATNGTKPKSILKDSSVASPASWSTSNPRPKTHFASDSEPSRNTTPKAASSSKSVPAPAAVPASPPQRKGPTVVRLLSPSDDKSESSHQQSEESDTDDSSSDDDGIPAARKVPSHSAIRGGGVSLRRRGRGRLRKPV